MKLSHSFSLHLILSKACSIFLLILTMTVVTSAQVTLPRLVRDSMVVQRDTRLKIWGWASKNEQVKVRFMGKTFSTKAGTDGQWLVWLPPVTAGGPYEMKISASNEIILKNILAGDVWFCSGQSNMVHSMELHKDRYAGEIAKANYAEIRQFWIPAIPIVSGPVRDFPAGNWKSAVAKDINKFSVVAYFFALALYEKHHIPIGIINSSVGGTPAEAWTSEEGLKEFPDMIAAITKNKDTAYVNNFGRMARVAARENGMRKPADKGLTEKINWFDTSYVPKNWQTINIPGYWEDQGVKDLDGVVWYRRVIELPASAAGAQAKIELGRIIDADFLYVNGKLVGNTTYQYPQRRYQVPAGLLKAGKNIFVIRVQNNGGKGGFVTDKPYALIVNGQTIDLKGYWQYKVGEVYSREGRNFGPGFSAQNQPASLYNGMVAPAINYAVKGFLWYQGEANTGKYELYKKLLPALVRDWRAQWKQGELPFFYAQLPNFMDANYSPSESNWAGLREAQLQTLSVPKTGMAVTIDLGEWNDIHPDNKKPIGDRLALAAEHFVYGDLKTEYSGPIYESARTEGNKIIISFSHTGSGLITSDGEELAQFAIAGKDKKFIWANARVENNTVVVWNDKISEPAFVRYAWADNPVGPNLSNKEGLPASPFRTDQ